MNVGQVPCNDCVPTDRTEQLRTALQVSLLKKALESQQEQAQEISRMIEGKGHVIDIRA